MTNEIDGIPKEAFEQYEEIRLSGATNMFSRDTVRGLCDDLEFDALAVVIDDGDYSKIMRNYNKAIKLGWIQGSK